MSSEYFSEDELVKAYTLYLKGQLSVDSFTITAMRIAENLKKERTENFQKSLEFTQK